ncbi:alpha-1,6-mannanase [Bacteroidales bacterium]|nr:alpha-1,6-mannanase [Bacteroidales bacterium]
MPIAANNPKDIAFDAFNDSYLDKELHIYRANSDTSKSGVAAIWTQAIYWDMAMNAYKRTKDTKYKQLMDNIFEGNANYYDHFNWDNGKVWFIYDDIMWWTVSLARAYEISKEEKYLTLSETSFERVWIGSPVVGDLGSYDAANGGMFWHWDQKNPGVRDPNEGKMACINYPTVIAAATLYNITKKKDYLDKAKEIYAWSRNALFDPASGRVADSRHGAGEPNWTINLYNQGTFIGAGVILFKETKDSIYLKDAIAAADYVKNKMSSPKGALPIKNGIEQGVYAAIFAQYIGELITSCGQYQYLDWIHYNIDQAWDKRDEKRNLTFKNIYVKCPTGNIEVYDASACPALMQVVP